MELEILENIRLYLESIYPTINAAVLISAGSNRPFIRIELPNRFSRMSVFVRPVRNASTDEVEYYLNLRNPDVDNEASYMIIPKEFILNLQS